MGSRSGKGDTRHIHDVEDVYRQLVEHIGEGIVMQDDSGIITYANDKFLQMVGYPPDEVLGHPVTEFLGEGILKKSDEREPESEIKDDRWRPRELAWKRKDGHTVYTILSPEPIYDKDGRFSGSVAVLTDITARRNVEIQLKRSREELRALSQHIHSVREEESSRIAREIHDELGQNLTAVKMDLAWLSNRIVLSDVGMKKYFEKVQSMSNLIDQTIHTVQKISAELRPGLLDDLGLIPAIEWLAQDFQNRTNIQCDLQIDCDDIDFRPDVATMFYRISQESLTNVVRHSKASKVKICLEEKNGFLEFTIYDNGRGIKERYINAPTSLGLMGMRERLRPYDGKLEIEGKAGLGTTLKISLHMSEAVKND